MVFGSADWDVGLCADRCLARESGSFVRILKLPKTGVDFSCVRDVDLWIRHGIGWETHIELVARPVVACLEVALTSRVLFELGRSPQFRKTLFPRTFGLLETS